MEKKKKTKRRGPYGKKKIEDALMRIPDKVMMEYEEEKWLGPTTSQSSSETKVRLHFHCLWRFHGIICRRVVSGKGVASGERWRYVSPPPLYLATTTFLK